MARAKQAAPRRRKTPSQTTPKPTGAGASVLGWEDDPGEPSEARQPVPRPVPTLDGGPLPISINERAPAAKEFAIGSAEFRYWAAAEALRRGADFWAANVPPGTTWNAENGPVLPIELDEDADLNAYYDRNGLHFFHGFAGGETVYSGESPDVSCHELGHAVLDALRPQLWDAMAGEVAAFHEAFGDMSAILSALQLESIRTDVIEQTGSHLDRSSRLSRLAEQLGWAIRQSHPDAVDADCLRNAANSFFYADPATLPPVAPATALSSEPHSFSRVFTGAFLEILAGMFRTGRSQTQKALATTASDLAAILVFGVRHSPVVPTYYSQVAAHMVAADTALFNGKYRDALKAGFVRHGVLSLTAATAPLPTPPAAAARHAIAAVADAQQDAPLSRIALSAAHLGLKEDLFVSAASHPKRFAVAGAAADVGPAQAPAQDDAAASFLEDIVRRGRVEFGEHAVGSAAVTSPRSRKSHQIIREDGQLVLVRKYFDCGLSEAG